jgi:hypothetical protein
MKTALGPVERLASEPALDGLFDSSADIILDN